jgi:hypothetical protein
MRLTISDLVEQLLSQIAIATCFDFFGCREGLSRNIYVYLMCLDFPRVEIEADNCESLNFH